MGGWVILKLPTTHSPPRVGRCKPCLFVVFTSHQTRRLRVPSASYMFHCVSFKKHPIRAVHMASVRVYFSIVIVPACVRRVRRPSFASRSRSPLRQLSLRGTKWSACVSTAPRATQRVPEGARCWELHCIIILLPYNLRHDRCKHWI